MQTSEQQKLLKIVFILSSGKSIVYTMVYENALEIFDDWKAFKDGKTVKDDKKSENIVEISKLKNGSITEKLGLALDKIDAIQIYDTV